MELDAPKGLSTGRHALVEKTKEKYRLRDFTERGEHEKLGLPEDGGVPASLSDALHRILWLVENQPRKLNELLDEARPDGKARAPSLRPWQGGRFPAGWRMTASAS